jgi:4-azaleucine resistance transporter AzlC
VPDRTVRDAAAIGVAVFAFGLSFGVFAVAAGLSPLLTVISSLTVFAGGSQFAFAGVLLAGGNPLAGTAAGLLLNSRLVAFGIATDARADMGHGPRRWLAAQLLTDESAALSLARPPGAEATRAFWWAGASVFAFWNLGTVIGALGGTLVEDPAAWGLDAAFPAGFLALVAPQVRGRPARWRAAVAGGLVAGLLLPVVPPGVPILAAALGVLAAPSLLRDPAPTPPSRGDGEVGR